VIEGRLSTASAKDELVKLATRLIIEEGLEGEASDAIGRDYLNAVPSACSVRPPIIA
jgi:putative transposase